MALIHHRLRRRYRVRIGHVVGVGCRDLRVEQVVDEGVGVVDVLRILRDGQHVEPLRCAFLRDGIGDVDAVARFGSAVARLDDVARPADHQADIAVGQVVDVRGRVEVADVGTDRLQQRGGLVDHGRIEAVRILAQVVQCDRDQLRRRVQHGDAAVLQLGGVFRLEHHVPAAGDGGVAEDRLDLVHVVADAAGAPQVRHGVLVSRVLLLDALEHGRVEVLQVGDLALVQRQEHAGLDLPAEEAQRGDHHVVAAAAGQQLGLDHLVAVEHVVGHRDAGGLLELGDGVLGDVVGPVVDVERLGGRACGGLLVLAATGGQGGGGQHDGEGLELHRGLHGTGSGGWKHHTPGPRRCAAAHGPRHDITCPDPPRCR